MNLIKIKPISVNDCWKGRRFKTQEYKNYEKKILLLIKKEKINFERLEVKIIFGLSSKGSDIDNPLKPFLDCLQKKLLFNDNRIDSLKVTREHVKKGDEFIKYEIKEFK